MDNDPITEEMDPIMARPSRRQVQRQKRAQKRVETLKRAAKNVYDTIQDDSYKKDYLNPDPSPLTPDDINDFESAAEDRPRQRLAPPYDPTQEHRTVARKLPLRASRMKTQQFSDALEKRDNWRLKAIRKHIKWLEKQAFREGIYPYEVDLWEL